MPPQLEVITVLGDIYEMLDATDKASSLFEAGLPIAERAFGPVSSYAPYLLGAMANSAVFAGDYRRAEATLPRAEAALAAIGDRQSLTYAKVLKVKGQLLRTHGPDGERQAVHVLQDAAALFSSRYPDGQSHVGSYMFLAQAQMDLEALDAAECAVNATAFLSEENTRVRANAYSLRASVLDRLGEVERAEQDYARASSDYPAALGSPHFLYLTNESFRGVALHRLGRRDEGLRDGQLDRALATIEHAFALLQAGQPPGRVISNTLTQIARLRMLTSDMERATRLLDEAITRARDAKALTAQIEADASIVRGDMASARRDRGDALTLARRCDPRRVRNDRPLDLRRRRRTAVTRHPVDPRERAGRAGAPRAGRVLANSPGQRDASEQLAIAGHRLLSIAPAIRWPWQRSTIFP
jgi:tetratricopeptide (TPR) repeat protein